MNLPYDVINKILIYLGELNKEPYILQYEYNSHYYKINPYSDYFFNIQSTLIMKRLYQCSHYEILNNKFLYKLGKKHYMKVLKENYKLNIK